MGQVSWLMPLLCKRLRRLRSRWVPKTWHVRLVVCDFEIPMKLFMMPHTVPNKPTKGAVAPNCRKNTGTAYHRPTGWGFNSF